MIPVSLTIKGLYSYQEAQTIDFDKLIEGQLFGIFGSVGSGKSSILEAISFALYGETERLNLRDNRSYNMMNLKSDELLIDFTFRNYDEQEYRFMVKGKRSAKDFDNVSTFVRSAYKKENGSWVPLESVSAEHILGLSYTNFRRTIIIPQGKFQEFLQLKDKERTDMLKEIFQLDKFEFFYQTTALEKKNNEAKQNLSGQLSHFALTTRELISEKEIQVKGLSQSLEKQRTVLHEKEKVLKEQEGLKKLFEDLEVSHKNLNDLLSNEPQYEQFSKKIKDYEYCLRHFKDSLRQKDELKASVELRKKGIGDLDDLYDTCCRELVSLEENNLVVKTEFLKQDEYKEIWNDYQHLLSLIKLKTNTEELSQRISSGQVFVDKALADKKNAENKIGILKVQIREQKTALPDLGVLAAIRAWFAQKENLKQNIQGIRQELKELDELSRSVSKEIQDQLSHPVLVKVEKGIPPHYYTEQVQLLRKDTKTKNQELVGQVAHYNLQVKLGEFSAKLSNGEPCMLCGSTHHPDILKVDDVEEHRLLAEQEIDRYKKMDTAYEDILQKLSGFISREQHLIQQEESIQRRLDRELLAEKELLENFTWQEFTTEDKEKADEQFNSTEKAQQAIRILESSLDEQEQDLKKANDDHEKFSKAIEELKSELVGKNSEAFTLKKQLKKLVHADDAHFSEEDLNIKASQLSQKIIRVKEEYEQLTEKVDQHKQDKISFEERKKSNLEVLAAEKEKYLKVEEGLKQALEKSPYNAYDEVSLILQEEFDIDQLKEQVTLYQQQVFAAKQLAAHLEVQCAGKSFDLSVYHQLLESIVSYRELLEQVNAEYITEKSALEQYKKDYESKCLLETQLEKLEYRASNLNTLKQLFKGSGFVSYVSSVYLHNLCQAANERFYKLTRQQLRLEVTDKNDFLVRDFLNNGRVRNVKTLSGGQTFQASLSLALALAESVQQQNKAKQNFFFLDEGFGSLDKESLQVAFETMKSLRKENRIVGIISHVEELQQEIDVYLNVVNDPFTGSKVKGSWE